jgi:proline dehydrogenase
MYDVSRSVFYALAKSAWLKRVASRYGMAHPGSFARRFIPGESFEEAVEPARALQAAGFHLTLDLLGENVRSFDDTTTAARDYVQLIDTIVASGIDRNISLKLTKLGADIDLATCIDNMRRVMTAAQERDCYVRIDMENSPYTELTFEVFENLWRLGYRNIGVALQAYLHRTADDVRRMNELGARVRLVKGAYKEPASVALGAKADVDAAFVQYMKALLGGGTYPAIATHDPAMIEATRNYAAAQQIAPERFEFQMLYGVRRDLQKQLVAQGYRVRVYVPFGREWFPYFMRRLGERPANVGFVIRALLSEKPHE